MDSIEVEPIGPVGDAQAPHAGIKGPPALAGGHPAGAEVATALVAAGVTWDPGGSRVVII
jgi:hypothetical protein